MLPGGKTPSTKIQLIHPAGNGVGTACEGDLDGDGVPDSADPCPGHPAVSLPGLAPYTSVSLRDVTAPSRDWRLRDAGREVLHGAFSEHPGLLVGEAASPGHTGYCLLGHLPTPPPPPHIRVLSP